MRTETPNEATQARPRAARPAGLNLTRINAWVDLALGSLMFGTGVSAYLDKSTHIVLGMTSMVGVAIHLGLHWRWILATTRRLRQIPARTQHSLLLVLMMLLTFIPLVVSGLIVALIYAPKVAGFHTWTFYLFVGLVLTHLVLTRRWIAARLRRRGAGRAA